MKTRDWNLYPYAKLIHLNRERKDKKEEKQQIASPSIISTIKTEIRSVVKIDVIEKYRLLKFEDVRRFFKSLSLEEEKEFSVLLANFYNNKSILGSRITDELVNKMYRKHTRTTISQMTEMVKEDESRVLAHFVNKNSQYQGFESSELETLIMKLKKQAEESELMLQKVITQKEEKKVAQDEESEDDSKNNKIIADNIMGQLHEQFKLENMRRGF